MSANSPIVYLIPSVIDEQATETIPAYVLDKVKECQVFFVENERTARRFLKLLWREMNIDDYEWFTIHKAEEELKSNFILKLREGKNVGIISEAGCPGVADPGQVLVEAAHSMDAVVKPLVGPSSILLALMASGMNGQCFRFVGYLPIDAAKRMKSLRDLEAVSSRDSCTQIFIETPYRNNQMLDTILKCCHPGTRLCIAASITSPDESIRTKSIGEWKTQKPNLHKKPVIFLLLAAAPNH